MSYQFYNNWPYSYTVFPTMIDHVDPVNNDYFTGLHQEIENIENTLGLSPEGDYATVVDRLDALGPPAQVKIRQVLGVTLTSDANTNSASFVDIPGMSISISTGENKVIIIASFSGSIQNSPVATIIGAAVSLHDGSSNIAGIEEYSQNASDNTYTDIHGSIVKFLAVNEGLHTYKLQWKRLAANSTVYCNPSSSPSVVHCTLTIIEIV